MKVTFRLFFYFLFASGLLKAQSPEIDSLQQILKTAKVDTAKVNLLNQLSESYWKKDLLDKAHSYAQEAMALSDKLAFKRGSVKAHLNFLHVYDNQGEVTRCIEHAGEAIAVSSSINDQRLMALALHSMATTYYQQVDHPKALGYFLKELKIEEVLGDAKALGKVCSYIGLIYFSQGNYPKALEYDLRALKYQEGNGNKKGMAGTYTNLGVLYDAQNNSAKALENYQKALKIAEEIGFKKVIAFSLVNIGSVYQKQGDRSKALEYLSKSLKIMEESSDQLGMAAVLNNIGALHEVELDKKRASKDHDSLLALTLDNNYRSLELYEKVGSKEGMAMVQNNIGNVLGKEKRFDEALRFSFESLKLAKEISGLDQVRETEKILSEIYRLKKDASNELFHYKAYIAARDSLFNEENTKNAVRAEMNFDFEKQQAIEKTEQEKKNVIADGNLKRQKLISYSVVLGLLVVLSFSLLLLNRFRLIRKQKEMIEVQKSIVVEKNKEITDSIHYAKRIQQALLASDTLLRKNLPEYFILYKPKDIVSGDFYWAAQVNHPGASNFLMATCDCTGHGVPGAFMSLLNISKLNDTVNEKKFSSPELILNDVREEIIKALNPEGSETEGRDGMDCSLCSFDFKAMQLTFALANNPLWLIRDKKIIEYKPDKMPVGMYSENSRSFTLQTLPLQKGDIIYTLTDGYADQFGGENGKKFKYKQLKELLLEHCDQSLEEQRNRLEERLTQWMGNIEQIDDILIIGVRV
ncbi:MAG TPA: tetratricopeptide repeat protein [Bacteroidia bacterium]|jgi:serine phosphatase RsbU (regulator of sigma subunit)